MSKSAPTKASKPAPELLSIYPALINIQRDIDAIPKDNENKQQGFNFRGIDDFYNALHPIFAAHGVLTIPTVLETTFPEKWLNAKGNAVFCARVRVQYDFTAADGSKAPAIGVGEAYDFGDKALNKAMSMAHKYVLAQMFQIPTAQPDGDAYTYEQGTAATQAAPEDMFAGKSLDQLTILRDEYIEAKQDVPGALLGRIAVLKADAADAIDTTPAPTKTTRTRANGRAAKAAEDAKPAETKPAAPARPAPIPPATDPVPGAAEEAIDPVDPPADDEFGDEEPSGKRLADALEFVIVPEALKHPKYAGRKLSSMSHDEINTLHEKWYLKFQPDIDKTPIKAALRDALLLVKDQWDKQPKK